MSETGPDAGHHDRDWFGHPVDERGRTARDPVACPLCGAGFTDAAAFRAHAATEHGHIGPTPRRRRVRPGTLRRTVDGLRFLPLWFVLPLNLLLTAAVISTFAADAIWNPAASLLLRFSLLPSILLLAARVAGNRP